MDTRLIERAAGVLRAGGLVAFPTETVYGLGANALDVHAVARVFEVKGRPRFDPLIVHLADAADAPALATHWPEPARRLAAAFWPGPLTIVVEKKVPGTGDQGSAEGGGRFVPDLVTAGLPTVALRVPADEIARELIRRAGVPVAAPSANRFGGVSPTRAEHVVAELGDALGTPDIMLLDGGPCETGVESTVVSVAGEAGEAGEAGATVLRLGGVTVEAIERVVGPVTIARRPADRDTDTDTDTDETTAQRGLASPGMLARHYAPATPVTLVEHGASSQAIALAAGEARAVGAVGALVFKDATAARAALGERLVAVRTLSPAGDLKEAAARLFAALRALDAAGVDRIVAERVPERGLGRAINDRLRRAAR